jgi:hypothetical protein
VPYLWLRSRERLLNATDGDTRFRRRYPRHWNTLPLHLQLPVVQRSCSLKAAGEQSALTAILNAKSARHASTSSGTTRPNVTAALGDWASVSNIGWQVDLAATPDLRGWVDSSRGVHNWLITPLMSPLLLRACATPRTQLRSVIAGILFPTQPVLAAALGKSVASVAATEPGDKSLVLVRDFAEVTQTISLVTLAPLPGLVSATA